MSVAKFEIWWCEEHGWVTNPPLENGDDAPPLCAIHVGQDDECLRDLEGPWVASIDGPSRR